MLTLAILHYVHTVCLCAFVRLSEQTAIFSFTALAVWFFITEAESVYCAVRTGSKYDVGYS